MHFSLKPFAYNSLIIMFEQWEDLMLSVYTIILLQQAVSTFVLIVYGRLYLLDSLSQI